MANISRVVEQLKKELERAKNEVERYGAALVALGSSKVGSKLGGQRRTLSAAARRKISLAQKARWAKQKASGPSHGPKRTISAASRRRMVAAQKARWAKAKRKS
jgi:hypothetical protein